MLKGQMHIWSCIRVNPECDRINIELHCMQTMNLEHENNNT